MPSAQLEYLGGRSFGKLMLSRVSPVCKPMWQSSDTLCCQVASIVDAGGRWASAKLRKHLRV